MLKYKDYLQNDKGHIKHIILREKSEFRSRFNHFWGTWISTLIALPYLVIAMLLYFLYEHSSTTIVQVICAVSVFLLIPLGYIAINYLKGIIEDYIFDEFVFPQIEEKYIKDKYEDFED